MSRPRKAPSVRRCPQGGCQACLRPSDVLISRRIKKKKNSTLTLNRYHVRHQDGKGKKATELGVLAMKPALVLIAQRNR